MSESTTSSRLSVDALAILRKLPTPERDLRDAIADSLEERVRALRSALEQTRMEVDLPDHIAEVIGEALDG